MRFGTVTGVQTCALPILVERTIEMCEVTHVDPRCVASCVAANAAIYSMLHGETNLNNILEKAFEAGKKVIGEKCQEQIGRASCRERMDKQEIGRASCKKR